jgi:dTMP kinase
VAGFALVPHVVFYLRAEVDLLVQRVVLSRGQFDYWESGMDLRFGPDMYESFVKYQARLIRALDSMAEPYSFTVIDASQPIPKIFQELQRRISRLRFGRDASAPKRKTARPRKVR